MENAIQVNNANFLTKHLEYADNVHLVMIWLDTAVYFQQSEFMIVTFIMTILNVRHANMALFLSKSNVSFQVKSNLFNQDKKLLLKLSLRKKQNFKDILPNQ